MSVSQFLGDEMTQPFEVLIIQLNIIMTSTLEKKETVKKIVKIKGNIPKIQNSEMNHHLTDGHVFV